MYITSKRFSEHSDLASHQVSEQSTLQICILMYGTAKKEIGI